MNELTEEEQRELWDPDNDRERQLRRGAAMSYEERLTTMDSLCRDLTRLVIAASGGR